MDRKTARIVRWAVPVAVAGLVVGAAQLSAWAASSPAQLPAISARDLLVKAQQSQVSELSGTVRSSVALGLPALPSQSGADWSSLVAGTRTLRVFAHGPSQQRVDLLGDLTQASVVHDGRTLWTWSSTTRQVTRTTLPEAASSEPGAAREPAVGQDDALPRTPQEAADRALAAVTPSTGVSI